MTRILLPGTGPNGRQVSGTIRVESVSCYSLSRKDILGVTIALLLLKI